MKIHALKAKTILNSQKKPTIAVELATEQGVFSASAPAGISTGKYEAVLVEPKKAVENVNGIIAQNLIGQEFESQKQIDELLIKLDGTADKSNLGGNTLLAVSIASCRALSQAASLPLHRFLEKCGGLPSAKSAEGSPPPLPKPMVLLIEGGKHSGQDGKHSGQGRGADAGCLDVQEFMAAPQAESFSENFKMCQGLYKTLEQVLAKRFSVKGILTGAEGGFTPPVENTEQALDLIMEAIKKAGLENKIKLALDIASSSFYRQGAYYFAGKKLKADKLTDFYLKILKKYPIVSLEDPFSEEDWLSWQEFNLKLKTKNLKLSLVADDLTVTNSARIKQAKENSACNAVIIKPNQIGTVTETIESAQLAKSFGWQIIVSHRAGETKDDFIADLAVGLSADYIKTGGPEKPERRVKYDRLLAIESEQGQPL